MATFSRGEEGVWSVTLDDTDATPRNDVCDEAVPRYLSAFDPAYTTARGACESEFVKALIRVSSLPDAGWDP